MSSTRAGRPVFRTVAVSPVGGSPSQRFPTRTCGPVVPSLATSVAVPSGSYRIIRAVPQP
jgi:hypothetical protein